MLVRLVLLISCVHNALSISNVPGKAVPHADVLDEILTAHIPKSRNYNPDSIIEYIVGNSSNINLKDNLAMNVLDVDNVRRIIDNVRRQRNPYFTSDERDEMAWRNNSLVVNKSLELIIQSIYATRYRIKRTKPIRDKFSNDYSFKIAVLYGACRQVMFRMDNYYGQTKNLPWKTHFIWFLILYEKIMAHNIDINDMVARIFHYHKLFFLQVGGEEMHDYENDPDLQNDLNRWQNAGKK